MSCSSAGTTDLRFSIFASWSASDLSMAASSAAARKRWIAWSEIRSFRNTHSSRSSAGWRSSAWAPLGSLESHLIYTFRPGWWLGASGGYDFGAHTTVNGKDNHDGKGQFSWAATFGCSIIGGYVVRGREPRRLRGRYLYGDLCTGALWSARVSGATLEDPRPVGVRVPYLVSFGEDARGRLYAVSLDGRSSGCADAQPFVAPSVRPPMNCFCRTK